MQNLCDIVTSAAWNNSLESRGFRLWSASLDTVFEGRGIQHGEVVREFSAAFEGGLCRSVAAQGACERARDILDTGWRDEAAFAFASAGLVTWCAWFFRGEPGSESYAQYCTQLFATRRLLLPEDLITAYAVLALNCPYEHTSMYDKAAAMATVFLSVKELHRTGGDAGPDKI